MRLKERTLSDEFARAAALYYKKYKDQLQAGAIAYLLLGRSHYPYEAIHLCDLTVRTGNSQNGEAVLDLMYGTAGLKAEPCRFIFRLQIDIKTRLSTEVTQSLEFWIIKLP